MGLAGHRRRRVVQAVGAGVALALAGVSIWVDRGSVDVLQSAVPADAGTAGSRVVDPSIGYSPEDREYNTGLLLEVLGPDFRAVAYDAQSTVELKPDTVTARGLPDGYRVTASALVVQGGPDAVQRCRDLAERDPRSSACRGVAAMQGTRTAQVQDVRTNVKRWRVEPSHDRVPVAAGTRFYFNRRDDAVVMMAIIASDLSDRESVQRQKRAVDWLSGYTAALAELAADDRIKPLPADTTVAKATPAPRPPSQLEVNRQALLEVLGKSFELVDGEVRLKPGSPKAQGLPRPEAYAARGALKVIDRAAAEARCGPRGFLDCEGRELPDASVRYWKLSVGLRQNETTLHGSKLVLLGRGDGTWVEATLRVEGVAVAESAVMPEINEVRDWLESFEDALFRAVGDERVADPDA